MTDHYLFRLLTGGAKRKSVEEDFARWVGEQEYDQTAIDTPVLRAFYWQEYIDELFAACRAHTRQDLLDLEVPFLDYTHPYFQGRSKK